MPRDTGRPKTWKLMRCIVAAPRRHRGRHATVVPARRWPACGPRSYSPSPNLSSISAAQRVHRRLLVLAVGLDSTSLPMPAASIITPMMLLALTRRPLRLMQTSLGKLPASLVSLAEARACRPSLLLMVSGRFDHGRRLGRLVLRPRRSPPASRPACAPASARATSASSGSSA